MPPASRSCEGADRRVPATPHIIEPIGPRLVLAALFAVLFAGPAAGQPATETFAEGLDFPTNMAFAPDGRLFFTEKNTGRIRIIEDGRLLPRPFAQVPVVNQAEAGLLGIALDPDFDSEPWVYLYYSSSDTGRNELVRIRADGNVGTSTEPIIQAVEITSYHNGGDIVFGTDGMLYAVVGEAHDPTRAQDQGDIGGKVLRLEPDGSVPADNPFGPGNPVFTLGHRNSFGLCVDPESGAIWETENGPAEHDEVNILFPGQNYGWPEVSGPGQGGRFVDPAIDFPEIIVPTGCAFYPHPHLGAASEGALFFGDYQGTLHRAVLGHQRTSVPRHHGYLRGLGGITDLAVGPDQRLYVATDDAIVRLPAEIPEEETPRPGPTTSPTAAGPVPTVPPEDGDGAPTWLWVVAGAGALAAGVTAWALRGRG